MRSSLAGVGLKPHCESSQDLEARLLIGQYNLACSSMRPSILAMPAFCAVLCLIYSQWISLPWLAGWWFAVTISSLATAIPYHLQKAASVDVRNIEYWVSLRSAFGLLHNIVWTLPAYVFWPFCSELGQLLLILIYACTLSGGVALLAPCPRWMLTVISPLAVALVAGPLSNGTWTFLAISVLSLGYMAFMGHLAVQLYTMARNTLLLREEKAELIAKLSEAKQQSDEARERAETANRAKSRFLANMSHELRTPLNAVLGFSDLIQRRIWGDHDIARYVDYAASIHASGSHLLQLINDILDLAKIEAGKFELKEDRIELISVARQALRLVETQAQQKGLRALIDASKDVWLCADERALRQILANLLSNAVKFTPRGGAIVVFIGHRPGEDVSLVVRDSGVGIRPEDLGRVMESFGQGRHEVSPTTDRGTGLGLPIVKGLVEAHGGELRIASTVGVGTEVIVTLPESRIFHPNELGVSKIA